MIIHFRPVGSRGDQSYDGSDESPSPSSNLSPPQIPTHIRTELIPDSTPDIFFQKKKKEKALNN